MPAKIVACLSFQWMRAAAGRHWQQTDRCAHASLGGTAKSGHIRRRCRTRSANFDSCFHIKGRTWGALTEALLLVTAVCSWCAPDDVPTIDCEFVAPIRSKCIENVCLMLYISAFRSSAGQPSFPLQVSTVHIPNLGRRTIQLAHNSTVARLWSTML
jgi:hypothetical protein